eukprot:c24742_g1_i1 orf=151-402(+)
MRTSTEIQRPYFHCVVCNVIKLCRRSHQMLAWPIEYFCAEEAIGWWLGPLSIVCLPSGSTTFKSFKLLQIHTVYINYKIFGHR